MEEENQTIFATLGLFVIYNNTIEDDMLSRKQNINRVYHLERLLGIRHVHLVLCQGEIDHVKHRCDKDQ
jgi:hypothetical protein